MDLWCNKRLTVLVDGPEGRLHCPLSGPYARLGSHPASDVVLPGAPKRSLYLHATDAGIYCVNLREHGNVKPERLGRWLTPDSTITIDGYRLTVQLEPYVNLGPALPCLITRMSGAR